MKKIRRPSRRRLVFCCVLVTVFLIIILHPSMNGTRTYEHIERTSIYQNLFVATASNYMNNASIDCDYDVLYNDATMAISVIDEDETRGNKVKEGGEFSPDCKPKFSSAIIVPYRDRPEQLRDFIVYMHTYLQHQNIHYRIYIVEQLDSNPFNRAKLLNIGAKVAMEAGYPCLILHDVDLLPLKLANLYACTKQPRHMSSIINTFRFVLPYVNLFGGAISIVSQQFKDINGMSNKFFGWGGEDDDLYSRLESHGLNICRFDPDITIYHMQNHAKVTKNGNYINNLLETTKERMETDGLNTLTYTHIGTQLHARFTHIMVDL